MQTEAYAGSSVSIALAALLQGLPILHRVLFPAASHEERAQACRLLAAPLQPADLATDDWAPILSTMGLDPHPALSALLKEAATLAGGPTSATTASKQLHSIFSGLGVSARPLLVLPPVPAVLSDAAFPRPVAEVGGGPDLWQVLSQELARLPDFSTTAASLLLYIVANN